MSISFFALLVMVISAILAQYQQLHTLQKNSYSLKRYFEWVRQSYTVQFALSAIAYCGLMFLLSKNKDWPAFIIAVLVLVVRVASCVMIQKNSTKKLLFTARVKRLYVTAIVLLWVSLFISAITDIDVASSVKQIGSNIIVFPDIIASQISRTVCMLLSIISPLLTTVVWLVTLPIEKAIAKRRSSDSNCNSDANDVVESAIGSQEETESLLIDDDSKGAEF